MLLMKISPLEFFNLDSFITGNVSGKLSFLFKFLSKSNAL
ncbi:MAG: hypothetical protein AB8B74_04925 [Crocinitomicaceae bacterium]